MKKNLANSIFIIVLIVVVYLIADHRYKSLEANPNFTVGTIHDISVLKKRAGIYFHFKFFYKDKEIEGKTKVRCSKSKKAEFYKYLLGKSMQIVYQTSNPDNNRILLDAAAYKRFKIPIPETYQPSIKLIDSICQAK